jgi:GH35 family endo-1,4-beta-xylanase
MNWTALDATYNLAKANGFLFRLHVLVWGNQQPAWIESLPPAEQLVEIQEWFDALAARYPDLDYVEVVNEPLHDPPNPGEAAAATTSRPSAAPAPRAGTGSSTRFGWPGPPSPRPPS